MNTATIGGIVRTVLAALAGYFAGKGIDITGLATPEVSSAIALVGVTVWSVVQKMRSTKKSE